MRFLMMSSGGDPNPDEQLYAEMAEFIQEMSAKGVLLATGGLAPEGVVMTTRGGELSVTDGPFAETREAVGGFALVEVGSKEEAIELGRRFRAIVGEGTSVIQQVFG